MITTPDVERRLRDLAAQLDTIVTSARPWLDELRETTSGRLLAPPGHRLDGGWPGWRELGPLALTYHDLREHQRVTTAAAGLSRRLVDVLGTIATPADHIDPADLLEHLCGPADRLRPPLPWAAHTRLRNLRFAVTAGSAWVPMLDQLGAAYADLVDAVDPRDALTLPAGPAGRGRGVRITDVDATDTARPTASAPAQVLQPATVSGEIPGATP